MLMQTTHPHFSLSLINALLTKISSHTLQSHNHNKTIFDKLLEYLKKSHQEQQETPKLLDLYCTVSAIFHITLTATQFKDLQKEVTVFFQIREDLLCGDSHDYCYTHSLANQLCYWLAEYLFPEQNPLNILLHNALTRDRSDPWLNPYTIEHSLPQSPYDFFRTRFNQIHLYEGVLEYAIGELKSGSKNPATIWRATDIKQTEQKDTHNLSLTEEDLETLKQRTPTFKEMVNYIKVLSEYKNEQTIFYHFYQLKEGLNSGRNIGYAREASHVAISTFSSWWNNLSEASQQHIRDINWELNNFITHLLTDRDYCTVQASQSLEQIIAQEKIRLRFNEIDGTLEYRVSNKTLDDWKKVILQELKNSPSIVTNKNVFNTLSQSIVFTNLCSHSAFTDYRIFKILEKIILRTHAPQTTAEKRLIIGDILEVNDTSQLQILYNFFMNAHLSKNDVIFFSILMKLHMNKSMSLDVLKKMVGTKNYPFYLHEFLYNAVYHNQLNMVVFLLALGANAAYTTPYFPACFEIAFLNKNVSIALALTEQNNAQSFTQQTILLTSRTEEDWQFVYHYFSSLKFHKFKPDYIQQLFDHAINHNRVNMIPLLVNLGATLSVRHLDIAFNQSSPSLVTALLVADEKLVNEGALLSHAAKENWECCMAYLSVRKPSQTTFIHLLNSAFQHHYVTFVKTCPKTKEFASVSQNILITTNTKEQWDFTREFIKEFTKEEFDPDFLHHLMLRAIEASSNETVTFLIEYGVKMSLEHLYAGFKAHNEYSIVALLTADNNLASDQLLLSETNQKNWSCVLAYLQVITPNLSIFQQVISNLLYQNMDDNWKFIRFFLDRIKDDSAILNFNLTLNSHQKRTCAIEFLSYLIAKETNPHRLVETVNIFTALEKQNPLMIKRIGYIVSLKGYQWDHIGTSRAWITLIEQAKNKILAIAQTNRDAFHEDDDDIKLFLNKPMYWATTFYKHSTSIFESYLRIKQQWKAKENPKDIGLTGKLLRLG